MAGRLTAVQLSLINSGAATRRQWTIRAPKQGGNNNIWQDTVIHDDDSKENDIRHVLRAGRVSAEGYNNTMKEPGSLSLSKYVFTVSNDNQKFYPEFSGNYFYNTTWSYQGTPQECRVLIKLWLMSSAGWSLIAWSYEGTILDIKYLETGDVVNGVKANTAIITAVSPWERLLAREWNKDDGWDTDTTENIDARAIP